MIKRNTRGITLIALVITIIILLVLAGVSISMISGENSILQRATDAKSKTELAALKEEIQLVLTDRITEKTIEGTNTKTLKENLEQQINNAIVEFACGHTDVYYVKRGETYVTIYEDGEIQDGKLEIWDGEKISCPEFKKEKNVWNWYIYTPSQLKFLADFVNNGNTLNDREDLIKIVTDANYDVHDVTMSTDTIIYLMNDLDLGARQKNGIKTIGSSWTPIGTNSDNIKDIFGTFDGNNKTIRGMYINREESYNGIFGASNTIRNLTIKDSYLYGKDYTGGIVGIALSGTIENCHNINTTVISAETSSNIGGIAGEAIELIKKCSNSGTVTGGLYFIGGITGYTGPSSTIIDCSNSGTITGGLYSIGGITGYTGPSSTINNCSNSGTITGGEYYIGGITGYITTSSSINDCINTGKVYNGTSCVGGIAGLVNQSSSISNCSNSGTIEGDTEIGGIAGYIYGTITKCKNSGKISAGLGNGSVSLRAGGIIGVGYLESISLCVNTGDVTGTRNRIGGVVGDIRMGNITQCANFGNVFSSGVYIGGVVGHIEVTTGDGTTRASFCYNAGTVTKDVETSSPTKPGGVIGRYVRKRR